MALSAHCVQTRGNQRRPSLTRSGNATDVAVVNTTPQHTHMRPHTCASESDRNAGTITGGASATPATASSGAGVSALFDARLVVTVG